MKRCSRCDTWLDLSRFSPNAKRSDGLQTYCRDCQRAYMREHYEKNLDYYLAKARRSNRKSYEDCKEMLSRLKAAPCTDCGRSFPPWVMDFDHVRGDKLFNMAESPRRDLAGMLIEVSKCDLVCANCHRERTRKRSGVRP